MAIKTYGSVNGQSKELKAIYGSVNGLSREIIKLYGSYNGVSKLIYQKVRSQIILSHKPASSSTWTSEAYPNWSATRTAINTLKSSYGTTLWDIKIEEGVV